MPTDPRAPQVDPRLSPGQYAQNVSAGLGYGLTNQLRGVEQLVRDPVTAFKESLTAIGQFASNPAVALQMLRELRQRAAAGPLGFGEVAGELLPTPGRRPTGNALRITERNTAQMIEPERLTRERNYYGAHDNTSSGILVYMPPQRFLQMAVEGGAEVKRRAASMEKFDVPKFNQESLPFLTFDPKKNQIVDHEGRARAARALLDRVPEIPVVIASRGTRFKSIDELPSVVKREHTGELVPLRDVEPIELLLRKAK
jgi:hypothetical protein